MTVLVGFVPTPEGRAALARAAQEASRTSSRLLVLDSADSAEALQEAVAGLRGGELQVEIAPVTHPRDPAEDILATAEREGVRLIVIGLRRRTPVGKLILGSNAQRILLDSSCPVLAVKASAGTR